MILLQGYGDDCNGTPENRKLSQADKDALLDIHNNLRYSVGNILQKYNNNVTDQRSRWDLKQEVSLDHNLELQI